MKYRSLKKYKYQLMEDFEASLGDEFQTLEKSFDGWIILSNGVIRIRKGYAWDGPSGPTIDTKNFLRASLVHDALYQLMRERRIPLDYRGPADRILRKFCLEDGMSLFRARYVYLAVRMFAGGFAMPGMGEPIEILEAP